MKVILLILIIFITGCPSTSGKSIDKSMEQRRQDVLSRIDESACLEKGGAIKNICMSGMPSCVQIFTDGGKACSDSSDCSGDCKIEGKFVEVGTKMTGFCSANSNPCGCFQQITDGKAEQALCVD